MENWKKKAKLNLSIFPFLSHNILRPLTRCIQNLKTPALIGANKSVTENLIGDKVVVCSGLMSLSTIFQSSRRCLVATKFEDSCSHRSQEI